MAIYTADVEAARGFLNENEFTEQLQRYRGMQRKPTLRQVEITRPGPDMQGFYERLDLVKSVFRSTQNVEFVKIQNQRARQALAQSEALQSSFGQGYDLSGVTPRYTGNVALSGYPTTSRSISSGYGSRIHPITGKRSFHTGIDFRAPAGTPIYATHNGTVTSAGWNKTYGYRTIVTSGGMNSTYSHQSRMVVGAGQTVRKGQVIGYVGSTGLSTGPHLHYEVFINGRAVNPSGYLQ